MQTIPSNDIAPLPADTYFDSFEEAAREAERRRRAFRGKAVAVNVQTSPYGGYVVRSVPVELVIDRLTNDLTTGRLVGKTPLRRYGP